MRRILHYSLAALALAGSVALTANAVRSSTGQPVPTETAVLSGTLNNGETIPLPTYADGTTALESECRWIVSSHTINNCSGSATNYCYTEGRTVVSYSFAGIGSTCVGAVANYLIIAVRQAPGATSASGVSWGSLKAAFGR